MLDDLQKIHERDNGDALGSVTTEWRQLTGDVAVTPIYRPVELLNVVYAGIADSAVAALLVSTWRILRLPFEVVRSHDIPPYVGVKTLFIACSDSGDTDEVIEATERAAQVGAQIVVIASGGRLAEVARNRGYPFVLLPKVRSSRFAVFYDLKVLVTILDQAGLCEDTHDSLHTAAEFLHTASQTWLPSVPAVRNPAKQIAQECMGRSVVIYSGPTLGAAAYRWKLGINENAKQVAWWNVYPEAAYNECMGWVKQPEQRPYTILDLRTNFDHPRIQKQFEVTDRLLSGLRPASITIHSEGHSVIEQLLWTTLFGDFVSVYLALLNEIDPTPLNLVNKLKQGLQ
jgi:glucose/mannose-6-phosphate isomerase